MDIQFKNCNDLNSKPKIDDLRDIILEFIATNSGYSKNIIGDSVKIYNKSRISLSFPPANSEWSASIAALLLLINSSKIAYSTNHNNLLIIRGREKYILDDIIDLIKKNMKIKVSICK